MPGNPQHWSGRAKRRKATEWPMWSAIAELLDMIDLISTCIEALMRPKYRRPSGSGLIIIMSALTWR